MTTLKDLKTKVMADFDSTFHKFTCHDWEDGCVHESIHNVKAFIDKSLNFVAKEIAEGVMEAVDMDEDKRKLIRDVYPLTPPENEPRRNKEKSKRIFE